MSPTLRSRITLITGQRIAVERTSALVVRLAAKVLLGKQDLPKLAIARVSHLISSIPSCCGIQTLQHPPQHLTLNQAASVNSCLGT